MITIEIKQILLVSPLGSVQRTVWRICILISGCRGLREVFNYSFKHCRDFIQLFARRLRCVMQSTKVWVTGTCSKLAFCFLCQLYVHTQIYTVYTGCVFYLMDTILSAELLIFMVMLMISTSLRRIHRQGLSTLM